jgi:hypothetical protein
MLFGGESDVAELQIASLERHESRILLPKSLERVDLDRGRIGVSPRLCQSACAL